MSVRWVVVDDEGMARRKLRELLAGIPWLEYAGEAADGDAGVGLLEGIRPDLVFLDIRMPGRSGIEVLAALSYAPAVIFTTAFDEYAVTAFELRALDYLVKPFSRKRLELALERVREGPHRSLTEEVLPRARAALNEPVPERIFIRDRGELIGVPVDSIRHIEARDDFSAIFAGNRRHLILRRLGDLEHALAPAGFVRIHRSHIVNRRFVAGLTRISPTRTEVVLTTGESLPVSRSRAAALVGALAVL